MAARIPVVISQSARREPSAVACEEKLITELLFAPGLDATLIGPLEAVETGSTDHLCLEGLKGPFALLGWNSIADCLQQLKRLGIHGSILDRDAKSTVTMTIELTTEQDPRRRIDYYRLRSDLEPSTWIESLKKVLEVREVKAFQIQIPRQPTVRPAVSSEPAETRPLTKTANARAEGQLIEPFLRTIDPNEDDEAWLHLDSLVDDLDRSDV